MTAYVVNASGNANDSTKYTPNGLPTAADTLTIGAFTLTIPSGYTLDVGAITMTGTSTSARATIIITAGGKLKLNGTMTLNAWNKIHATGTGTAEFDLNGNNLAYAGSNTSNINWVSNDSTCQFKIYSVIGGTSAWGGSGHLDLNNFNISGVRFTFGGGYYPLYHYRIKNGVFHSCGILKNNGYSDPAADFIIDNVEFRGCTNPETNQSVSYDVRPSSATTPTGSKYITNFVASSEVPIGFVPAGFLSVTLGAVTVGNSAYLEWGINEIETGDVVYYPNESGAFVINSAGLITATTSGTRRIWVQHTRRNVITPYNIVISAGLTPAPASTMTFRWNSLDKVTVNSMYYTKFYVESTGFPGYQTWNKIFSCFNGIFGDIGTTPFRDSYMVVRANNPHTMINACRDFQFSVLDNSRQPNSYVSDGGDHFPVTNGGTHLIKNNILLDSYGGVLLNALGVATRTGTYTLEHNTVVMNVVDNALLYGILARNENSGVFSSGATTTVRSNIVHVSNNPSNSKAIRVFNLETAANDQIDFLDNNCYSQVGSTAATVYYGVTYASGGAVGTQADRGLNDKMNVDPQFVDSSRNFFTFIGAQQAGLTDAEKVDWFLQSLNGFDQTTKAFDAAKKRSSIHIDSLLAYVRAGYAPTNTAVKNAGHDGVTIGAVEWVSTAQTFSYVGQGGSVFGGSAVIAREKPFAGAGGIASGGSAVVKREKLYAGLGGTSFGGAATVSKAKKPVVSGGAAFSGTATYGLFPVGSASSYSYTGSGGAVFGGSAICNKQGSGGAGNIYIYGEIAVELVDNQYDIELAG